MLQVLQEQSEARSFNSSEEMVHYWAKWVEKYPIGSIEDGFAENDWVGWKKMTERLGDKIQLCRRRLVRHQRQVPRKGDQGRRGEFNSR